MVPKSMVQSTVHDFQTVPSESNDIPKRYAIGLCAGQGRYRILPQALDAAWRRGEVLDRDLPELLYQGEAPLRLKNDRPGPLSGLALWHAIGVGVVALGLFNYYLYLLLSSR
jgi:hypothetical protein